MKFEQAFTFLRTNLMGYYKDTYGVEKYHGISREYYSKWVGWGIIDEFGDTAQCLPTMVQEFFKEHFWNTLRLDTIDNNEVAKVILFFSYHIGKKATVKKLQRILGVPVVSVMTEATIKRINSATYEEIIFPLLLEVLEATLATANKNPAKRVEALRVANQVVFVYYETLCRPLGTPLE